MAESQEAVKEDAGQASAPAVVKGGEKKKKKKSTTRDQELSTKEEHKDRLGKIRARVEKAFADQIQRTNDQADYWDIYECVLNDNQAYNGNAQAYISLGADAIDARQTRFTNQLFPMNGRYIEVTTENGDIPHAEMALIEHYIDRIQLKTNVVAPLCRNGDVEGQYNLYVTWREDTRYVVSREFKRIDEATEVEQVVEDEVIDAGPEVECLPDADVVIFPATANSVMDAIMKGGGAAITRRWTQAKIDEMVEAKEISKAAAKAIHADMETAAKGSTKDISKEHVSASGIKGKGSYFLGREVWHLMEVDGVQRIVRSYFGSSDHEFLGTKLNPYWSDLVPLFSCPVKKLSGAAKGSSPLKRVAQLQYLANDFLNEAADSATFAMLPIVMTDPNSNPKTSTMILDLAAVWEVDPKSTQFAAFPKLWEQGFEIIGALKAQVKESLAVNSSMMTMGSGKRKPSQAEIANEQTVDILTTAEATSVLEQGILTPAVQFMVELDYQFRDEDLLIPAYGMMGKRAKMERIPPLERGKRFFYKWLGVQAARNASQIQQQIAVVATVMKIPPQLYKNHRLDMTAFVESLIENAFGPRLAPLTFIDQRDELSIPIDEENKMLIQGFPVPVSPMDNDQEHIQKHQPLLAGDTHGVVGAHIAWHTNQMQMKAAQAMMQAQQQQGGALPGPPGQQGPGPRPGAQPAPGRPAQQPAGALHQDRMASAGAMPMDATQ